MPETFTFESRPLPFRPGQSVAAALIEAGERGFRETASGGLRSVFCGMGVCQDCLIEIDGVPNRRACMEESRPGLTVRRQPARARLDPAAHLPDAAASVERPDLLVIGAGAGGLTAAIAAAQAGARVLVADERARPGGQYYKQASKAPALDTQQRAGAALVARAREAGAEIRSGIEIWGAFDGPLFLAAEGAGALVLRPRAVIVATGAYERPRFVPGWHLPGVMTTGAAQTLWRSYRTLPGRRILVAGSGPLNLQVARELAEGGARVVAVLEGAPHPLHRPAAALRMATADPALAAKGAALLAALAARRVPVRHATTLARVEPGDGALHAHLGDGTRLEADAVLMNEGFHPSNEILRLLGCDMVWEQHFRELRPTRTTDCATSVPGVFAVGDCCGLGGAPAAEAEGIIAGAAAARLLGFKSDDPASARRALRKARAFQNALWAVYDRPHQDLAGVPAETLICRCEEVTKGALDAALAADPGDIGAVKRATRLGMGRCQGRYCGPALVAILAARTGVPVDERSHFAPRPPVKPVPIATIAAAEAARDALAGE